MLAIEAVRDARMMVDLVKDPVGIVLQGRGKHYYFVELRELREKAAHTWPHKVEHITLNFMGVVIILKG